MNAGPNTLPEGAQTISVQRQGHGVWALFVQPVNPTFAIDVVASMRDEWSNWATGSTC